MEDIAAMMPREHMMEELELLMDKAGSEREREAIRRCMNPVGT